MPCPVPSPPSPPPVQPTTKIAKRLVAAIRDLGGTSKSFPFPFNPKEPGDRPVSVHAIRIDPGCEEALVTMLSNGDAAVQVIERGSGALCASGVASYVECEGKSDGQFVEDVIEMLRRVLNI